MKFFTRDICDMARPDTGVSLSVAQRTWIKTNKAYQAHINRIHKQLPESVSDRRYTLMHGAVLRSIGRGGNNISLDIDTTQVEHERMGLQRFTFEGVRHFPDLDAFIGSNWLAAEYDQHPDTAFEFRVLTEAGEFSIAADSLEAELLHASTQIHANPKLAYFTGMALETDDAGATAAFYNAFGLTPSPHDTIPGAYTLPIHGGRTIIRPGLKAPAPHLIFKTPSIERLLETLQPAPNTILAHPTPDNPSLVLKAPDGLILEFIEQPIKIADY